MNINLEKLLREINNKLMIYLELFWNHPNCIRLLNKKKTVELILQDRYHEYIE